MNRETGRTATQEKNLRSPVPLKNRSITERLNYYKNQSEETEMEVELGQETVPTEAEVLRQISETLLENSELAVMKTQSAALLVQVEGFRNHYLKFEDMIVDLIQNNQVKNTTILKELSSKIKILQNTNQLLQNQLENETNRIADEMLNAMNDLLKKELNTSLNIVRRSIDSMESYISIVQNHHKRFERLEGIKFFLFTICCISSPIMTILFLLEQFKVTNWF